MSQRTYSGTPGTGPESSSQIVCGHRVFATDYSGAGEGGSRTQHCLNHKDGSPVRDFKLDNRGTEDRMQDYITAPGYASRISVTDGTLIDGFFRRNF